MKTILQRYLASSFILPFVVSTTFFVVFLLTFQLFRITDLIISKGVSIAYTLELIGYIALTFLPMAIPLSVLFSTLFVFSRLSNDSEYVALRSFGVKKHQIFKPFLMVAIGIGVTTYFLCQQMIPSAKWRFRQALGEMKSSSLLADIKSGQFFTTIPNITLFAEKVQDKGKVLENITINYNQPEANQLIFAQKGSLVANFNEDTREEKLVLKLFSGNITTIKPNDEVEKTIFTSYEFPIGENKLGTIFTTKASMMTGSELSKTIKLSIEELASKYMDKGDLLRAKIEYWSRYNTAILCVVFCFIGFVLGVKDTRGGANKAGLNLLVLVGYYAVFFSLVSLARKESIPAYLAVFAPTILLIILGRRYYNKMDWLA